MEDRAAQRAGRAARGLGWACRIVVGSGWACGVRRGPGGARLGLGVRGQAQIGRAGSSTTTARTRVFAGVEFKLYVYVNVKYDPAMTETYGIAELAREFGVTARTIRFYESEGLIAPLRDRQRRIYRPRDRTRLRLILRGRRLGFSLAEIREIVDLYDAAPGEVGQLELLLAKIAGRRAELEAKRADIEASLGDLESVARNCHKRLKEINNVNRRAVRKGGRRRRG